MRTSDLPLHTRLTVVTALCLIGAMIAAGFVLVFSLEQLEGEARLFAEVLGGTRATEARVHEQRRELRARAALLAQALATHAEGRLEEVGALAQRIGGDQLLGAYLLSRAGDPSGGLRFPRSGPQAQALLRATGARSRLEGGADLLIITNKFGQVVAANGEAMPQGTEAPAYLVESISAGLQGRSTSGLVQPVGGDVHWSRVEPLRGPDGRVAGAVVVGLNIARARTFLGSWRAVLGEELEAGLILPDGRPVSLKDPKTPRVEGDGAPQSLTKHTAPFAGGDLRAYVAVSLPEVPEEDLPSFSPEGLALRGALSLGVIALAAVLLLALLIGRGVAPLELLASRVRLISLGHLGIRVQAEGGSKEIGELAQATERLRISLSALMDRHPTRHRWN